MGEQWKQDKRNEKDKTIPFSVLKTSYDVFGNSSGFRKGCCMMSLTNLPGCPKRMPCMTSVVNIFQFEKKKKKKKTKKEEEKKDAVTVTSTINLFHFVSLTLSLSVLSVSACLSVRLSVSLSLCLSFWLSLSLSLSLFDVETGEKRSILA